MGTLEFNPHRVARLERHKFKIALANSGTWFIYKWDVDATPTEESACREGNPHNWMPLVAMHEIAVAPLTADGRQSLMHAILTIMEVGEERGFETGKLAAQWDIRHALGVAP